MTDLVVRGDLLIDGTGAEPQAGPVYVAVDDGRISAVSGTEPQDRRDADMLDLSGLTLLPGLIDAHTHMGITNVADPASVAPAVAAAQLFHNAEQCLLSGHTTAREVGGADGGLKEAIELGLVAGPRLYPSGPLLCQTGGHGHFGPPFIDHHQYPHYPGLPGLSQISEVCDGADEVRVAARKAFRRGATQIKVCVSGGVVSLTDDLSHAQFTINELRAAVTEAQARGTYVTAHAHNSESIRNGIEAGLECFEHGTFLDEQTVELLASSGAALVPTLAVTQVMLDEHEAWGIPADILPRLEGVADAMAKSLRMAYEAGVPVGSGTDLLGPDQRQRGLELALKADILGPMAAIVSATRTNAHILRIDDQVGTVEASKRADLVAVDFDPLAHPEAFADPDRVVVVVKDGRVVKDHRG